MGAQFSDQRTKTLNYPCVRALSANVRVHYSGGYTDYCADSDTDCLGITDRAFALGDYPSVVVRTAQGTVICTASGAISGPCAVYADTLGKVAASGTVLVGWWLEALTAASGDLIEVMLSPAAILGALARSALTQQDSQVYPMPITSWREHDAMAVSIPATATSSYFGLTTGTFGSAASYLKSYECKNTTTTNYMRRLFELPVEYVSGQGISLLINAGMLTYVASVSATLNIAVTRLAAPTVDIGSATGAQSINSATAADKTWVITPTDCVPGDILDIKVTGACTDGQGTNSIFMQLFKTNMLLSVRG